MKRIATSVFILILLISCQLEKTPQTAQEIVDKAIEVSQTDKLSNATLAFNFRGRRYVAQRNSGTFELQRITTNGSEVLTDVLSNNGFERLLNNEPFQVPDSMAIKYSESVNSVHYFSILPYGLNDGAVYKKLLPEVSIKNKKYYKIEVTFDQEGGGVDYEDVFVYWINKQSFTIDYLAYLYHVNGGGKRFREVSNEHLIDHIRLVDYNNYKPNNKTIDVRDMDIAFENGELSKVSEINLENITINLQK
jgi:hypothetical protein